MSAEAEIRRKIEDDGPITFAEFMRLALYWPQGGYYTAGEPVGSSGDYYTSPSAHPAFGALLAVQLVQMWRLMGHPDPFTVVELGSGNGLLGRDISAYSAHLPPEFRRSIRYVCLDYRAASGVERELPQEVGLPRVERIAARISTDVSLGEVIPLRGVKGCFLSNELLDAFPVHQVVQQGDRLREVYVALQGGDLVETLGDLSTPALTQRLEDLGIEPAEGQAAEINLGLDRWSEEVAGSLEAGFVLTIDYGRLANELYSPEERYQGTLTTFFRHVQTDDPLRHIGRQDMTAQVDFTSVINAGRRVGLEPLGYTTQRRFLANLGLGQLQRRLSSLGLSHRELRSNRAGMVDLVRPGGLGDFRFLVQGKNVGQPTLWGFDVSATDATNTAGGAEYLLEGLPAPLPTSQHLPLLEGRYTSTEVEFDLDELWPSGEEVEEAG